MQEILAPSTDSAHSLQGLGHGLPPSRVSSRETSASTFGPVQGWALTSRAGNLARLHQLRGLGDAKILKSLGHSPKGRHYRG